MIDAAAGFMSNTLNDVLSMSRIEDGAISLVVKPFSLLSLLDSAIGTIGTLAVNKAVRIVVTGMSSKDEAHGLIVIGDEVQLVCAYVHPILSSLYESVFSSIGWQSAVTLSPIHFLSGLCMLLACPLTIGML